MSTNRHDQESLKKMFVELYGCTFMGESVPAPYCDAGTHFFKPPHGIESFSVPLPTDGGYYFQWVIDRMIKDHKLERVKNAYLVQESE